MARSMRLHNSGINNKYKALLWKGNARALCVHFHALCVHARWRPEVSVRCPPLSLSTILRQALSLTQDLENSAGLAGRQALILSSPSSAEMTGTCYHIQLSPWVLGSTHLPMLLQWTFYMLSHTPSPCSVTQASLLLFHFPSIFSYTGSSITSLFWYLNTRRRPALGLSGWRCFCQACYWPEYHPCAWGEMSYLSAPSCWPDCGEACGNCFSRLDLFPALSENEEVNLMSHLVNYRTIYIVSWDVSMWLVQGWNNSAQKW